MTEISTSILGVEEENSIKTFYNLEVAGTNYYHIDVMDGKFVEQNTEKKMYTYVNEIKQMSNIPLDVHLMVENIKENIDRYLPFDPEIITFHIEACSNKEDVMKLIKYLQENKVKCGISIKPQTKIDEILEFLPYIYLCLVMTVEPGKGGQTLLVDMVNKIKELKEYIDKNNFEVDIEADGGINLKTCDDVKNAGANILVSGTAILSASNYKTIIDELKK